jgi:hypothetical protein
MVIKIRAAQQASQSIISLLRIGRIQILNHGEWGVAT